MFDMDENWADDIDFDFGDLEDAFEDKDDTPEEISKPEPKPEPKQPVDDFFSFEVIESDEVISLDNLYEEAEPEVIDDITAKLEQEALRMEQEKLEQERLEK